MDGMGSQRQPEDSSNDLDDRPETISANGNSDNTRFDQERASQLGTPADLLSSTKKKMNIAGSANAILLHYQRVTQLINSIVLEPLLGVSSSKLQIYKRVQS